MSSTYLVSYGLQRIYLMQKPLSQNHFEEKQEKKQNQLIEPYSNEAFDLLFTIPKNGHELFSFLCFFHAHCTHFIDNNLLQATKNFTGFCVLYLSVVMQKSCKSHAKSNFFTE